MIECVMSIGGNIMISDFDTILFILNYFDYKFISYFILSNLCIYDIDF